MNGNDVALFSQRQRKTEFFVDAFFFSRSNGSYEHIFKSTSTYSTTDTQIPLHDILVSYQPGHRKHTESWQKIAPPHSDTPIRIKKRHKKQNHHRPAMVKQKRTAKNNNNNNTFEKERKVSLFF